MTDKDLLRSLGDVNDEFIHEAAPNTNKKKSIVFKIMPIAACIVIAIGAIAVWRVAVPGMPIIYQANNAEQTSDVNNGYPDDIVNNDGLENDMFNETASSKEDNVFTDYITPRGWRFTTQEDISDELCVFTDSPAGTAQLYFEDFHSGTFEFTAPNGKRAYVSDIYIPVHTAFESLSLADTLILREIEMFSTSHLTSDVIPQSAMEYKYVFSTEKSDENVFVECYYHMTEQVIDELIDSYEQNYVIKDEYSLPEYSTTDKLCYRINNAIVTYGYSNHLGVISITIITDGCLFSIYDSRQASDNIVNGLSDKGIIYQLVENLQNVIQKETVKYSN
ncbi:MAG: hypothetical protein J1E39_01730 [Eubacterium sp.]|nr:hypothetical protein [Eubacterium sp.]